MNRNRKADSWFSRLAITALLLLTVQGYAMAAEQQAQPITPQAACAACGMYPHQYPQWQTQVIFNDGTMAAFDGGKCMFRYLLNMKKFAPDRDPAQVAAVWVKDFGTGAWIDGKTAWYVVDSKVMGPMGRELIPFATEAAANDFQKANGGTVAAFQAISMDTIKPLMGGMHHMKQGGHGAGPMHNMQ
ncbi:MAG: nitrous oxide reductase accessory protein NosL [Thermodesulfobacteriota bacterium]